MAELQTRSLKLNRAKRQTKLTHILEISKNTSQTENY